MSLSSINTLKEQAATYQALILAQVTSSDGAILRLSTADLTYSGSTFWGRIITPNLGALQELSAEGLDIMPSVTFTVADPDKACLDWDRAHGLAGSRIDLVFVYYDWDSSFSSDSYGVFVGRCGLPGADDLNFTFTAASLLNLSTKRLPVTPVQMTCPWNHPDTTEQKALASTPGSLYYRCGDTTSASSCDRTKANCVSIGMYALGRFGGFQWAPPLGIRTEREYITGNKVQVQSSANNAKYGDWIPLVYGTAWVDCPIDSVIPDGNSTRGIAIVCDGEISSILKVVCDDELLPPANDLSRNAYQVQDALMRYNVVGNGTRDGQPCPDKGFDSLGDPHGSMVTIEYCVPRKVDSPRVSALIMGRKVRVYSDSTTYTTIYSENPVWIIADILNLSGWDYADMNLAQFVAEAAWCDAAIPYTDSLGNSNTRPRYAFSLVIRQRRTVADLVQGLRRGCNGLLNWSGVSGLLEFVIKKTLADQQPSAPDGTNSVAVSSIHADETSHTGVPAYDFRDYNIETIRRIQGQQNTPNTVSVGFINADNDHSGDSARIIDIDALNFDGQENASNIQIDGPNSISHARAIGDVFLSEQRRGNPRGDAKGSETWEISTTSKGVKLRVGQLIQITSDRYSL